jgi:hypothetical protein
MRRFIIILLAVLIVSTAAGAETVYTLCQPNSFVYARIHPRRGSEVVGRLELGDAIETDGVRRNGFLLVYGFETGEAWVNAGFLTRCPVTVETVQGQIVSKGRVACRRSINGTRRKWLKNGAEVVIYAVSDDWSITNKGFVQTRYLGGF